MKTKITLASLLALFAAGQTQADDGHRGRRDKVEMCHKGSTIIVSAHAAVGHLIHGDSIGACDPCDPPVAEDGKVTICKFGKKRDKTKRVRPGKACREVARGKAEFGACGVRVDSDDDYDSYDSDSYDSDSGDFKDDSGDSDDDDYPDAPADADGDGVPDGDDSCPGTAEGDPTDAGGCSCAQRGDCDADGDGVLDQDDACPGTAPGDSAGADGCSCAQRGDCDADGDGVYDQDDLCANTPAGDETYGNGCTVITLSASAGPDIAALPGDVVDVVGQGAVLTGDYPETDLVYLWEQVGGDPVWYEYSSPPLTVDTEGSSATATFLLTVSTADGSATATDEFTISVNLDAVVLSSAVCNPATGHCYARIETLTWCSEMKAAANNMYYNGMRGHLATITDSAERSFLATVARNAPGIIAGTDRFEEGVWVWDDGPEEGELIGWLPWASENEPNNLYHWSYPEGEDYISNLARGWDDLNGWRRYYVEFEPGW